MAEIVTEQLAREIIKKVSDAAIELAFTRHELTTTEYEAEEYADVDDGVEAFKSLVEEVKADTLACLVGDDTGCLDPEDIDFDNECEWLVRQLHRFSREVWATAQNHRGRQYTGLTYTDELTALELALDAEGKPCDVDGCNLKFSHRHSVRPEFHIADEE